MARTIQELAQEAVFVQSACNFIAVVNGMARAMADLRAHGITGDALATHPIAIVWTDKLTSLQGIQNFAHSEIIEAHAAVERLTGNIEETAHVKTSQA